MVLAYSGGRCEVSSEEGRGVRGDTGSTDRLFGLQQESPGAAQPSEEETSLC